MTFNADERGLEVLQWWQDRCLEWCYARFENGKFGDQKYLDDWTERFKGVHVLRHLGGGVAPWNVQQYKIGMVGASLQVDTFPLIFYHFHGYKYYKNGVHDFVLGYKLSLEVVNLLYFPYAKALLKAYQEIYSVDATFKSGWAKRNSAWKMKAYYFKCWLLGVANEYRIL
jgi:hypothetical protein